MSYSIPYGKQHITQADNGLTRRKVIAARYDSTFWISTKTTVKYKYENFLTVIFEKCASNWNTGVAKVLQDLRLKKSK